jgi:hypothetical protein
MIIIYYIYEINGKTGRQGFFTAKGWVLRRVEWAGGWERRCSGEMPALPGFGHALLEGNSVIEEEISVLGRIVVFPAVISNAVTGVQQSVLRECY